MGLALERGDDVEVRRISTFLAADASSDARSRRAEPKNQATNDLREQVALLVGNWAGQYIGSKTALTLMVKPDGQVSLTAAKSTDKAMITIHDGRMLILTTDSMAIWEHFELVPSDDRLLALGWVRKRGENPLRDKPSVAVFLERVDR